MSLALIDRPAWANRLAPTHALWLGPLGLWDFGPMPGWRPWSAPTHRPSAPRPHAGFEAWCQAHPGTGCSLILSAWLLHELLLDAQQPLADDTARLAHARSLLLHYHGDAAAQWPLAAWHAAGRRGVSALHALTLPHLQSIARGSGVALRTVRPWWSLALALAMQQVPRLAHGDAARVLVADGALVTQIDLSRGRLSNLQQRRLPQATLAALPVPAAGLLCCALGHGLSDHDHDQAIDFDSTRAGAPPGITLLGSLAGEAPAALWCSPADAARAPAA